MILGGSVSVDYRPSPPCANPAHTWNGRWDLVTVANPSSMARRRPLDARRRGFRGGCGLWVGQRNPGAVKWLLRGGGPAVPARPLPGLVRVNTFNPPFQEAALRLRSTQSRPQLPVCIPRYESGAYPSARWSCPCRPGSSPAISPLPGHHQRSLLAAEETPRHPRTWEICPPHLWVSLSWRSPRTPPGGCPQTGRKTGARPRKRRRWELAHKCACEPKIRTPGGPHTRARDKRRGGPTYVFRFTREDLSFATGALHKCMS